MLLHIYFIDPSLLFVAKTCSWAALIIGSSLGFGGFVIDGVRNSKQDSGLANSLALHWSTYWAYWVLLSTVY